VASQGDDAGSLSGPIATAFPLQTRAFPHFPGASDELAAACQAVPTPRNLSGMVRDLCEPLTALVTSVGLLADDVGVLPPEQQHAVQTMQRRALQVQSRSENLLCAAAIWDGLFRIHPRSIDLWEVVSEVQAVVMPFLSPKRQRLETTFQDEAHWVRADPRRLAQILVNLILNASEHGDETSAIGVRIATRGAGVRISVADRGQGIAADRILGFFELVRQPTTAVATGGVGLGLAMVRSIAEAHGGNVGARNRRNGGASVWFELPSAVRPFATTNGHTSASN
jgi:signal transduction histidine kinase